MSDFRYFKEDLESWGEFETYAEIAYQLKRIADALQEKHDD